LQFDAVEEDIDSRDYFVARKFEIDAQRRDIRGLGNQEGYRFLAQAAIMKLEGFDIQILNAVELIVSANLGFMVRYSDGRDIGVAKQT
jgi:hypothetical protein